MALQRPGQGLEDPGGGAGDLATLEAGVAEQHDEWAEGRRYLGLDVLARAQAVDNSTPVEEVTEPELQALTV